MSMSMPMSMRIVMTTLATKDQAQRLAETLVLQGLAACVHINRVDSVYLWQGQLHTQAEWRLLCKTSKDRAQDLRRFLEQNHPYELPAIVGLAVDEANAEFERWIWDQTHT